MNPLTPYLWLIKLAAAALLVAGVAFGVWLYGHHRYEAGVAAQRAAESRSLAVYTKARDAQLASAEASYHAEINGACDDVDELLVRVLMRGRGVTGHQAMQCERRAFT